MASLHSRFVKIRYLDKGRYPRPSQPASFTGVALRPLAVITRHEQATHGHRDCNATNLTENACYCGSCFHVTSVSQEAARICGRP